MERVSWSDLKTFIDARSLSAQFVEYSNFYKVWAFDGPMFFSSLIKKTSPVNADQTDFETNYKSLGNKKLDKIDTDTEGIKVTTQFAPDGFYQRLHEIEFTTSTLGGAIHDKDINNADTGWSSVTFYKDVASVETAWTPVDQADLDSNCIRTDYHFMPNVDYMVKSGVVSHQELINVPLNGEIYMWGKMLDVDASLQGSPYFIQPIEVLGGGMAMSFVNARDPVGLKGVNGSMLYYAGIMHPVNGFIPITGGLGTNRITFVMRHNAGIKHRFQAIFEIFRA